MSMTLNQIKSFIALENQSIPTVLMNSIYEREERINSALEASSIEEGIESLVLAVLQTKNKPIYIDLIRSTFVDLSLDDLISLDEVLEISLQVHCRITWLGESQDCNTPFVFTGRTITSALNVYLNTLNEFIDSKSNDIEAHLVATRLERVALYECNEDADAFLCETSISDFLAQNRDEMSITDISLVQEIKKGQDIVLQFYTGSTFKVIGI